jgi:hypothetical protein
MNTDKYTLSKRDMEKMIERLRGIVDPSSAVVKFIAAYENNPNVIMESSVIERKGKGNVPIIKDE